MALLDAEKSPQELTDNAEFRQLEDRAAVLQAELDDTLTDFEDMRMAVEEISRHPN